MRGIQINNFFENHYSLNGKKINNNRNAIINSHRPKPIVIHHAPISPEPLLLTDAQSPAVKSKSMHNKRKKRSHTYNEVKERKDKPEKHEKGDRNPLLQN